MKNSIEYLRSKFLEFGYILVSKEYSNNKQLLSVICPFGHSVKLRWNDFQQGYRCGECSPSKRCNIEDIRKAFQEEGFTLLSDTYHNNRTRLRFVCFAGHINTVSWHDFKMGNRCSICSERKKYSLEDVRVCLGRSNYILLSTEYSGTHGSIECCCPFGHKVLTTFSQFKRGVRCAECCGLKKKTLSYIISEIELVGYSFLGGDYINNKSPIMLKCNNGHIFKMSWNSFQRGYRCSVCSHTVSRKSQRWLDKCGISNNNREVVIRLSGRSLRVDGFDPKTNTVYEFFGDYWHGNPLVYAPHQMNMVNRKTFSELYIETLDRIFLLKSAGYNVVYIWENDFIET